MIGELKEFAALPNLALPDKSQLPGCCAIYFAVAKGQVLYVGMATNLKKRWQNHHRCFQLENISKQREVRLFWLACLPRQLAVLERQYTTYYAPMLNQSKVPTQSFVPSSVVLTSVLGKLKERFCPATSAKIACWFGQR